jgi:beta-N-acetylhexosaminidase
MIRKFFFSLIAAAVVLTGIPLSGAAASPAGVKDLVIDLNVPQVTREVEEQTLKLNPLQVLEDGSFRLATENLTWKSSNKNVGTVTQDGEITLSGQNGTTKISVSDGTFSDRISIQYKGNQGEILVKKEEGARYDLIGQAVGQMTMEEKVGQMLMPDFRNWKGQNVTVMNEEISKLVKDYHLGGVILFRENTVSTEQTVKLVDAYQQAADKFGLLISIDQEGGIVTRLQMGTDFPGNMALGAARSGELAEKVGKAIGEELHALGINMNFAPVLDVNNNPDNPVIGVRSFGENPELVGDLGKAYIRGLQETGTAATAKHFPGHGDTNVDSHIGLPSVPHDLDRLKEVELYPFQQAMDAGIDAIMTAHVTFPKVDDTKAISKLNGSEIAVPATLSHKVLTSLMRDDMGYEGVIVTDAMNMKAISDHFGPVDAAVRAVQAGADILLMPVGIQQVAEGLYAAVNSGEITKERIEQSAERVLTLKLNRGILKGETEPTITEKLSKAAEVVGSPEHKSIEKEAAAKSITLVKNNSVLPLQPAASARIVVVGSNAELLAAEAKKHHGNVEYITASAPLSAAQLDSVKKADAIILGTSTSNVSGRSPNSNLMKLANQLVDTDVPMIAVGIRNPYDIMAYPDADAYLAQYGFRPVSFEASVETIFGKNRPAGKLPVTIYSQDGSILFGYGHGLEY